MNKFIRYLICLPLWGAALSLSAQELEPRRWAHLPIDTNYAGGGYAHTEGDIVFDPVLRVENAEVEMDSIVFKYIRSFRFLNKSAQISLAQAQHNATWSGLLDGIPTSIRRIGLSDPILRFAINLKGAPPLKGKEYRRYRAAQDVETIVGAGLAVQLPLGENKEDKLINLGTNRFTIRPQLGVIHKRGNWTMEATGAVWFYTDNNEFFDGNKLEQEPLLFLQGHLIHQFKPGQWAGLSVGYASGGESTINGVGKDDRKQELVWALSYGFAIAPRIGFKVAYVGSKTKQSTGIDSDSLAIGLSTFW